MLENVNIDLPDEANSPPRTWSHDQPLAVPSVWFLSRGGGHLGVTLCDIVIVINKTSEWR